jgi:hypothetical protein
MSYDCQAMGNDEPCWIVSPMPAIGPTDGLDRVDGFVADVGLQTFFFLAMTAR